MTERRRTKKKFSEGGRLRRTPSHIANTFKRHRPSPPLNADDYWCHPPPLSPRFECCVSLCPRRLAFVHCCRHWKMPPPSNAPAHHPVLHQIATHSQLHSTSEYMGMMWGYLRRNPTNRWTTAAQSTGSSSAYAMRIQPPVSTQSNHRPWWWSSPPAAVPAR